MVVEGCVQRMRHRALGAAFRGWGSSCVRARETRRAAERVVAAIGRGVDAVLKTSCFKEWAVLAREHRLEVAKIDLVSGLEEERANFRERLLRGGEQARAEAEAVAARARRADSACRRIPERREATDRRERAGRLGQRARRRASRAGAAKSRRGRGSVRRCGRGRAQQGA